MKSKILTVRISDKLFSSLSDFAALSDRSVSQICRYAVSSISSDVPISNLKEDNEDLTSTAVSFRLTNGDVSFLNEVAVKNSLSLSDVVRYALLQWLESTKTKNTHIIPSSEMKGEK